MDTDVTAGTSTKMPIVDSHVHVFSPYVYEHREKLIRVDRWFGHLYERPEVRIASTGDLLDSMEIAGVDQSILCGFPWSDHSLCQDHNDYMANSVLEFPDRLGWIGTVVPHESGAAAEAERCFQNGAVGIGELNADAQGFDLADPEPLAELVEVCMAWDRPIMFHVSEPVGRQYPGKGTATPDKLLTFLRRFPDVRVVAAHWGGGLPFYELMPEVARLTTNVVYDSAATTYLYRFPVFRAVLELVGARRVLFASDYPVLGQERLLQRVKRLGMPDDTFSLIMSENARNVFRGE